MEDSPNTVTMILEMIDFIVELIVVVLLIIIRGIANNNLRVFEFLS